MSSRFLIAVLLLSLPSFSTKAIADAIWFVGEASPVYGVVESMNEKTVQFRRTSDGKTFESVSYDRDAIESIVSNFDSQRLTSLAPNDWPTWQLYAEELISQKQDPVAQCLAMRLLVIVAGNTTDASQKDAALADLILLARDSDELKSLQTLRYLESGVKPPKAIAQRSTVETPIQSDRNAAIELVQSIRQGNSVDEQALSSIKLKETIDAFENVCSWQELVQISRSNRIDNQQLQRLVSLEFRLRVVDAEAQEAKTAKKSWHLLSKRSETSSLDLPTIENVTEFDPRKFSFVDGDWIQR